MLNSLISLSSDAISPVSILQPPSSPIIPLVAVILPLKSTDDAVICPPDFNNKPLALMWESVTSNPAISESPIIFAFEAVIIPELNTLKPENSESLVSYFWGPITKAEVFINIPAASPDPPVSSITFFVPNLILGVPVGLIVKSPDVNVSVSVKPPILPCDASIEPLNIAEPSRFKWNPEDDISIFPSLPLMYWALCPK